MVQPVMHVKENEGMSVGQRIRLWWRIMMGRIKRIIPRRWNGLSVIPIALEEIDAIDNMTH